MFKFKKMFLKLVVPVAGVIGLIFLLVGLLATNFFERNEVRTAEEQSRIIRDELTRNLNTIDNLMSERVQSYMKMLIKEGTALGAPSLGAQVQVGDASAPNLIFGSSQQANNFAVVDKVKEIMGGTATLFVKRGEDFIRVSTNVQKADGSRAIGTQLDPNGKAIVQIRQGKAFYGVVDILGKAYLTGYEPMRDSGGNVVGIWYVGYQLSSLEELGKNIATTRIMDSGFVMLMDDKKKAAFKSSHTPDDVAGPILATNATSHLDWHISRTPFDPWGYTIVTAFSESDPKLSGLISRVRWTVLGLGLVLLASAIGVIIWFTNLSIRPLKDAVEVAKKLAKGDLEVKLPNAPSDETGQLINAMDELTGYLREMAAISDEIAKGSLAVGARPRSAEDRFGNSFKNMISYLEEMANVSDKIASGNLMVSVNPKSDEDRFGNSFKNMISYLEEMANVSDKIAGGNLTVNINPKSDQDRFGNSFKNMLDNTLSLVQSQDERERMQDSIMKLLGEVSDVANGDLTVEAEVTPEATGAIADSFNYMVAELRNIIYRVKDTTVQVGSSATELQVTAERLAERSDLQAAQIADTSSAIGEMAASIQQVSEHATMSANVAEQSLHSAQQGTEAVNNNIRAMNRIREQVQETAKRIKRLGERSQEISEIVQLIDDISDRTSMLALNASIQAAMAGEAGRGFAVVAEEVERLAERSTNATKQIAALTKTIQSETNEVVASMEETTREVVEGSSLANEAGSALNEIEVVSKKLAELIQSISQTSKQQARGSAAISESMQEVAEATQQTASSMKKSAVTVTSLAMLAEDLNSSVASFRLPSNGKGNGNGNGHAFNGLKSNPNMN